VRQARREYRRSESTVKDFVRDRCVLDAEAQTSAGTLYKAHREWASANGLKPVSNKRFAQEMKGIEHVTWQRTNQHNRYLGVMLKAEGEEMSERVETDFSALHSSKSSSQADPDGI
jgi:phage/plasmid-associated DNA primase